METLQNLINNIEDLAATGATLVGALVAFATVVVAVTPTDKDDKWLGKVVSKLEALSILKKRKDEKLKEAEKK